MRNVSNIKESKTEKKGGERRITGKQTMQSEKDFDKIQCTTIKQELNIIK